MDVLHLIRPWVRPPRPERGGHASTDASLIACRTLIGAVGGASPVLAVGPAAGERRAALLGLVTHDRIAAPAGSLRLARPAARAFVADRGAPDAVCCWAPGLEVLAAAMVGRRARILSPRLDDLALADTGGPTEGGVDSRIAARAGLGLPPGGFILGLLADPPSRGDERAFVFILSLLSSAGARVTGVVCDGGRSSARARRFERLSGMPARVVRTDQPIWTVLDALDAAVLHGWREGPFAARCLVASAHSRGVPVAAELAAPIHDLYGPGGDELRPTGTSPTAFAAALLPLHDDRERLRDRARRLRGVARAEPLRQRFIASLARQLGARPDGPS